MIAGCSLIVIKHVYREANLTADWMVSFVVAHSDLILWIGLVDSLVNFRDCIFF